MFNLLSFLPHSLVSVKSHLPYLVLVKILSFLFQFDVYAVLTFSLVQVICFHLGVADLDVFFSVLLEFCYDYCLFFLLDVHYKIFGLLQRRRIAT